MLTCHMMVNNMSINYELRSYGNRETGEAHYLVDGVEVTRSEYDRCLTEYQQARASQDAICSSRA